MGKLRQTDRYSGLTGQSVKPVSELWVQGETLQPRGPLAQEINALHSRPGLGDSRVRRDLTPENPPLSFT